MMRTLKIAAITILFLTIPHQAPLAGNSGSAGQATPHDEAGAGEPSTTRPEHRGMAAMAANEGFVWSLATAGSPEGARSSSGEHLEIDGYSWSARAAGAPLAPTP